MAKIGRPRKQTRTYNRDLLYAIGKDRGFRTHADLDQFLMARLGYTSGQRCWQAKLSYEFFTFAQMKLIVDALEMTPEEVLGVFFSDTFVTISGKTYAHLTEENRAHYRKVNERGKPGKQRDKIAKDKAEFKAWMEERRRKKKQFDEMLDEL